MKRTYWDGEKFIYPEDKHTKGWVIFALLILLCVFLAGCDPDTDRYETFDKKLIKDEQGRTWIIEHAQGDTYHLIMLKGNNIIEVKGLERIPEEDDD